MATAKLDIKNSKIILIFAILMLLSSLAFAIPNTLTLQGKLTNKNGVSQQGSFTFQFRIYDVPDFGYYNITQNATFPNGSFSHEFNVTHINYTNILWEQNQTVVTDANGVYDVVLHDINLSFAYQYWLGITVGSDNESTPRVNLSSAPYSFRANVSEALNANNSYFVTNLSVSGNLTVGTIFYIDSANARIGINTTSPAQTLTLQGTLNVTPAGRGGNASLFVASSGFVGIGITNPQYLLQVGNASKAVNLSNILFVSGDSGNVGIGTSSPTALLQLAASAPELRLNSTNGGYIGLKTNSAALTDFDIQQNGTSRLYIDTSGNVGIGTTTPGEILHVIGNVNASGVYKGDADGSATAPIYTYYNDTNTGEFSPLPDTLAFTTGGTERARIDSSGSVGIGTTSPYNTLTVVGSVGVSGSLNASSINTTGSAYFATSSGSVGIGTTSPYNTLTVVGSVGVSGSLNASSINTTGSAYFATSSGSVGIGTTSPGQKLVVVGGVNITGGLNVTGDTNASNLYTTGNVVLGDASTDTIAVNAQFTTNLIPNQNNVDIGSATNFWRRAYFDRATISNLSVTGNTSVGGTNSPTWTLNSNYTGDDAIDVELILERGTPTINAVFKWDSTDKRFDINFPLFIQANQNLTVDTNTLFVDGSINRVGIGTATPTHTLTVAGDINATGAIFGGAINVTSGGLNILGTSDLGIGTSAPDNRLTIVGSDRDSNLPLQGILHLNITDNYNQSTTNLVTLDHLLVNPNNASTIAQAGGIGIGILFRAINNNSEVVNVSFINASLVNARNGSEASALSFYTRSGNAGLVPKLILNGSDVFIAPTSGNVGIGTTSPNDALEVVGNVRVSGSLNATNINASRFYARNGTAALPSYTFMEDTDTGIMHNGQAGNNISIVTGGSARMTIDSSGNVGIGTTSPLGRLNLVGVSSLGALTFTDSTQGVDLKSWQIRVSSGATPGELTILPITDSGSGLAEVIQLTRGGNVGIGTTTPGSALAVVGNFSTTTGALLATSSGNVGIGTPVPGTMFGTAFTGVGLHLNKSASSTQIVVQGNDGGGIILVDSLGPANRRIFQWQANRDEMRLRLINDGESAATRLFTINATGFVGIGTASPQAALSATNMSIGATYSGTNAPPVNGAIIEGNVGINQTSPASRLEVAGTFNATSSSTQFLVNSNGDVVVNLKG